MSAVTPNRVSAAVVAISIFAWSAPFGRFAGNVSDPTDASLASKTSTV
jgi:hypothetical protein